MSWQKASVMEEKARFIKMWESGVYVFSSLCESFGISRRSGYNLINSYKEHGELVFEERSKRPLKIPHKTPLKIEKAILELRKKYKNWGARKIRKLLEADFSRKEIPSKTTINAILKRNGLIKKKRRRYVKEGRLNPKFDPEKCNEIWSSDYKGHFKMQNGRYCYPLTVCDSKSRMILGISCHYRATYVSVKQSYIKIFREYGLPEYMHTDNGSPFGNVQAVCRFTRLCYWLVDQGVMPVFSDPGCPQQNGRHERMHRDLKAYCKPRIATTLSKQQQVMDAFKKEYNGIRPHESLDLQTPVEVHKRSNRAYRERKIEYDYPSDYKVYKVTKNGAMRWGAFHWVFISQAAIKKYIGVKEIGNGIWNVYYRNVLLGCFDEKLLTRKEQYLRLYKIKV